MNTKIIANTKDFVAALEQADREYNNDKKNTKKREVYRYVAAQEAILNDLCYELEIDDLIDDGLDEIDDFIDDGLDDED